MQTHQLRRYELDPERATDFVDWFGSGLAEVRTAHGFTIEWAYLAADRTEFTWLVSFEGDVDAFLAAEAVYSASDASKALIAVLPDAIRGMHTSFVAQV
jgi:hypothetical protein